MHALQHQPPRDQVIPYPAIATPHHQPAGTPAPADAAQPDPTRSSAAQPGAARFAPIHSDAPQSGKAACARISRIALEANYHAAMLSGEIQAAYWLAEAGDDTATAFARGRLAQAERTIAAIAQAFGYRLVRIAAEDPPAAATEDRAYG